MTTEIRCANCGKLFALHLEGELELYCPRCHVHQKIVASTAMIEQSQNSVLTNIEEGHTIISKS